MRSIPSDGPPGALLAELADETRRTYYRFVRLRGGVLLRFHGTAEFVGDDRLSEVTVHVDPGTDPALVPVLVAGPVIATRLILDGHLVLHASALQVGDGVLAFVGRSGMGKSTMAALGLLAGYPPFADDVLRVDLAGAVPPHVWPGGTELRLRDSARSLAERADRPRRKTADNRTAVAAGKLPDGCLPLRCCVVPFPDRRISEPSVRLLPPFEALHRMLAFPRIVGWQDPDTSLRGFEHLATLCQCTPVLEARLPWGPPFSEHLVPRLLDRIDDVLSRPLRHHQAP